MIGLALLISQLQQPTNMTTIYNITIGLASLAWLIVCIAIVPEMFKRNDDE
jgi:hypothetical protein